MFQHKLSNDIIRHTISCSICGVKTPKNNFETAGEAADHARHAGFTTYFTSLIAPATWRCPRHSLEKKEEKISA